jgi:protein SCO1/2
MKPVHSPVLLILPAAALLLARPTFAGEPSTNACCRSACCQAEAPAPFTDKSLYQVESTWTTDTQKQMKLGDLAGRPQVVAMFFANCQYACPIIVNDMRRIEAALPPERRDDVGFTLVSFDSKRDTPATLAAYRQIRRLPANRWTLLHGEPDEVLELAALLGVRYKEDAQGQFAHSNVITILNAQGEIVHQQVGLNQDIRETVRVLETLAGR